MTDPIFRIISDSTSTPEEYRARLLDRLRDEHPGSAIFYHEWETVPNGFWRRLFRRPERGHFQTERLDSLG